MESKAITDMDTKINMICSYGNLYQFYFLFASDPQHPEIVQLYQFRKEMFSDKKNKTPENKQ